MLSNHRYMLGVISVAIASWLGGADLASGTDLAAARAFVTSGPGIGEPATDPMNPATASPVDIYFANWFARVDQARESQPHWLPLLMTLSPLITELLRQDAYYQRLGNGARLLNLRAGKGLFLVPSKTIEVDFVLPTFQARYALRRPAGLTASVSLPCKSRRRGRKCEHA